MVRHALIVALLSSLCLVGPTAANIDTQRVLDATTATEPENSDAVAIHAAAAKGGPGNYCPPCTEHQCLKMVPCPASSPYQCGLEKGAPCSSQPYTPETCSHTCCDTRGCETHRCPPCNRTKDAHACASCSKHAFACTEGIAKGCSPTNIYTNKTSCLSCCETSGCFGAGCPACTPDECAQHAWHCYSNRANDVCTSGSPHVVDGCAAAGVFPNALCNKCCAVSSCPLPPTPMPRPPSPWDDVPKSENCTVDHPPKLAPNSNATKYGGMDVTGKGCKGWVHESCCGYTPRFNWVLSTCNEDPTKHVSMACKHKGANSTKLKVNYIAAYQWNDEFKMWIKDPSSSIEPPGHHEKYPRKKASVRAEEAIAQLVAKGIDKSSAKRSAKTPPPSASSPTSHHRRHGQDRQSFASSSSSSKAKADPLSMTGKAHILAEVLGRDPSTVRSTDAVADELTSIFEAQEAAYLARDAHERRDKSTSKTTTYSASRKSSSSGKSSSTKSAPGKPKAKAEANAAQYVDFSHLRIGGGYKKDWDVKYGPTTANRNTDGLGPPGMLFIMSADEFAWGSLFILNQLTLNRGPGAEIMPDNCWSSSAGEFDLIESPFWAGVDLPLERLYVTTTADAGRCLPATNSIPRSMGKHCNSPYCCEMCACANATGDSAVCFGFEDNIKWAPMGCVSRNDSNPLPENSTIWTVGGSNVTCAKHFGGVAGGADSNAYFGPGTEGMGYIYAGVIDHDGTTVYRWPQGAGFDDSVWPGVSSNTAEEFLTASRPARVAVKPPCTEPHSACGIHEPSCVGDCPLVEAAGRFGQDQHAGAFAAENARDGNNWWDLFLPTGQIADDRVTPDKLPIFIDVPHHTPPLPFHCGNCTSAICGAPTHCPADILAYQCTSGQGNKGCANQSTLWPLSGRCGSCCDVRSCEFECTICSAEQCSGICGPGQFMCTNGSIHGQCNDSPDYFGKIGGCTACCRCPGHLPPPTTPTPPTPEPSPAPPTPAPTSAPATPNPTSGPTPSPTPSPPHHGSPAPEYPTLGPIPLRDLPKKKEP